MEKPMKRLIFTCIFLIAAIAGIFIALKAIIGEDSGGYANAVLVNAACEPPQGGAVSPV